MTQAQPPTGAEVPFGQHVPSTPEQRVPVEPVPGAWSTPGAAPPPGQPHAWPPAPGQPPTWPPAPGQPPTWPPAPGQPQTWPPPAPPGQRRTWLWVVVAGIAVLALSTAAAAVLFAGSDTDGAGGTTTVIDEDFSGGTGAFEEFEEDDFVAQRRDGAYELTGTEGESTYWSSAGIDRSSSVDVSARLELVEGEHPAAAVGLSVEPNGTEAYFLTLTGDGTVALERALDDEEFVLPLTMTEIEPVDGAVELRLTVVASGDSTELTGWVDGEQVVRHVDAQGWDEFDGIGVMVATGPEPGTARADDVVVKTAR